jgi:hypothetical protein
MSNNIWRLDCRQFPLPVPVIEVSVYLPAYSKVSTLPHDFRVRTPEVFARMKFS